MSDNSYMPKYLTNNAALILENKKGYRDNSLFPEISALKTNKRDPVDVVYKNRYVEEIDIPDKNILLCDMGIEGVLISYYRFLTS